MVVYNAISASGWLLPKLKKEDLRNQTALMIEGVAIKKMPPTKRKGKSYSSRWARMGVNDYRL